MLRTALLALVSGLLLLPFAEAADESLAADGRVAVVADRQGLVFLRPAGRQRWTPVGPRSLVFPGDRLRTETRGAHALDLRLAGGARLTLGPGAVLDVDEQRALTLRAGEAEILGTAAAPLTLRGPGGEAASKGSPTWVRARPEALEVLPAAPRWLTGYRSGLSDEWMGALVATVDGREVPLTVGSHKVDVEIRDQVARTTIVESFVNGTGQRLEGVFRFPLPAEASIAGFGMWIGDELVEADVVERERARQIYEDILRRKKDPGLLEWAGGNVFQARVFPIEPHAEKRVRLVYTEVLPLEGATWRYRYALRSELLRLHPLRELSLTVRAVSTAALAEVTCPTHADAKVTADAHTASVELSQRDVSPDKDFEVAGRLGATDGLTVVTHRRGDDGWFLLLVQPPDAGAAPWQRDLVPEGKPLDVILALDTSGSVDPAARRAQRAFLTALLGLLGPEDRVRACTFDVETRWMAPAAKPADADTVDAVLRFLDERAAMGWTDLDGAVDALLAAAGPGTQVVVVGDGIGTAGDGDPVALAQRIRQKGAASQAVVHAVAPASTYEKGVLEALSSIGGGSLRLVRDDPAGVAQRLVTEAALPLVRDLEVEIQGVPTARVYPQRLPNLALGAQQAVLGRFLPTATPSTATVVLRGTLEGKPLRFSAPLAVPASGEGNSFLPRLWARRHLDALLAQGDTAAVKDDVVRLSTEYGILTPYTSLLVLENDEEREKYGVERRVRARDGEAEFAATRDAVALEAARRAAKEGSRWRSALRRSMLREIAGLGRDLPIEVGGVALAYAASGPASSADGGTWGRKSLSQTGGFRGAGGGVPAVPASAAPPAGAPAGGEEELQSLGDTEEETEEVRSQDVVAHDEAKKGSGDVAGETDADAEALDDAVDGLEEYAKRPASLALRSRRDARRGSEEGAPQGFFAAPPRPAHAIDAGALGFPGAGAPLYDPPLPPDPPDVPADLRPLLDRTLGTGADAALHLGVERRVESSSPLRPDVPGTSSTQRFLRAPGRWFTRTDAPGLAPTESALEGGVATTLDVGRRLARAWNAGPAAGWTVADLRRRLGYPDATAVAGRRIRLREEQGPHRVLVLDRPPQEGTEVWVLDRATGAMVSSEVFSYGESRYRTLYLDVVEVGGLWWAGRTEHYDAKGRLTQRTALTVEAHAPEAFEAVFRAALAGREDVLTLGPDLPTVKAARAALAGGRAGFAERVVLTLERLALGRHAEASTHLDAALASEGAKPGAAWLRAGLLLRTRRGEELRRLLTDVLAPRAAAHPTLAWPLAATVDSYGAGLGAAERLALLDALEGPWTSGGRDPLGRWAWTGVRAPALAAAGRVVDARTLIAARAAERPWDVTALGAQAETLDAAGEPEAAIAFLAQALDAGGPWTDGERDLLEQWRSDRLFARRAPQDLVAPLAAWTQARPESAEAWRRWVSALTMAGEDARADAWIEQTLATVGRGPTSSASERARLEAAVTLALGQGWGWWAYVIPARFAGPLAGLATECARRDDQRLALGQRLWQDHRLVGTDPGQRMRAALALEVLAPGATDRLPIPRLATLAPAIGWGKDERSDAEVDALRAALGRRLDGTTTSGERRALAEVLALVSRQRGETEHVLAVRRHERDLAQGRERVAAQERLFQDLIAAPHDEARETEALRLVPELLPAEQTSAWRNAQAGRLLRSFTPWAVRGRAQALEGTPDVRAQRTRAQAREAQADAVREARRRVAAALATPGLPEVAEPWAAVERLGLLSENREALEDVAREALAVLGLDFWPDVEHLPQDHPLAPVLGTLRSRAALLLAHAATRRGAPPALAEQALTTFEARWADERHDWRYESFRLLVALDRIEDLRRALGGWIASTAEARWRKALAYLEAALGHLAPAVAGLEGLRDEEGALAAGDWSALALWLLAQGETQRRGAALHAAYEATDEWTLANRIRSEVGGGSRGGPGGAQDLNPEVLPMIEVLLAKAAWPQNHLWVVQELYQRTKDHRVLAGLVAGVAGHSAQGAYPFLQALSATVKAVHEEAALDLLRAAVTARLATAQGTDARPLRLLAALVEVRASQVLLRDPAPAVRAAAALRSAAGPLDAGELRPLAAFLASLPFPPQGEIADARMRLLESLAADAEVASGDRLVAERAVAQVLWGAARHDEALDRLAAGYAAAEATHDPRAQPELDATLDVWIEWLAVRERFGEAATLLSRRRSEGPSLAAREQAEVRLYRLWARALAKGATLRLGRGEALYREAAQRVEAAWMRTPHLGAALHGAHMELGRATRDGRVLGDPGAERVRFAAERLPALLRGQPGAIANVVENEAALLAELAGPRAAIRHLLERAAAEPRFYARLNQDVWAQNLWNLAQWRTKGEPLGTLEAPLLAYVLEHLSAQLESDATGGAPFWQSGNQHFWSAHVGDFAAAVLAAAEKAPASPARQRTCAQALQGLGLPAEAIGLLQAALGRGAIDRSGRDLLLSLLLAASRYAEALTQADALLAETPESLDLHLRKARALSGLARNDEAVATLAQGLERLPGPKPAPFEQVARVAGSASQWGLHAAAVAWFEDVFRRAGNAPSQRGWRAGWRAAMARSLAAVGRVDEAVDAATAAVVGTNEVPRLDDRGDKPGGTLGRMLLEIPDFGAYVERYEARVAKDGVDAPLLRKALALVARRRGDRAGALHHLEALRTLAPADTAVLRALSAAYLEAGDENRSREALEALLVVDPGDAAAWADLGRRLAKAGRAADAERANTGAIEARPLEPEGHRLLAGVRRDQGRHGEAALRWAEVTRLRPLEPEARLEEAKAWIAAGEPAKARRPLEEVLGGTWEARFATAKDDAARLLGTLAGGPR